MKPIGNLTRPSTKTSSTTPAGQTSLPIPTDDERDLVNKIFQRLTYNAPAWRQAIVGDARDWTRGYKIDLYQSLKEHRALSANAVEHGIRRWKRLGKPWMPSPGEFAELCNPREHASYKPFKADSTPKAKLAVGQKHIAEIRANRMHH